MGLIAIATSDGVTIDGRLDTPGTFYIYHFDDSRTFTLVEQRSTPQHHHHCPHQRLLPQAAALLLADVQLVLVAFVPRPTDFFTDQGNYGNRRSWASQRSTGCL